MLLASARDPVAIETMNIILLAWSAPTDVTELPGVWWRELDRRRL